jgi:hypothetical protein
LQYEFTVPAHHVFLVKTGTYTYDVYYTKQLNNGITNYICREFAKRTVDFKTDPPEWKEEKTIDVASPSGFANPILPYKNILGYDFYRRRILFVLGEWDGASWLFQGTKAKLLAVDLGLSKIEVLNDNLFTLAQEAVPEATHIKGYANFGGYGGKLVGILAAYSNAEERSVALVFDGSSWYAVRANTRRDTVQEGVVPIWDVKDRFIGWLTEGHSDNSHFIRISDFQVIPCYPPFSTTSEPVYDMINHKIVWTEWGAGEAISQRIYVSDPDPTNGCINFKNATPYGTVKDNEGNTINLTIMSKYAPSIFQNGANKWLVIGAFRGGIPEGFHRVLKVDLGSYSDASKWDLVKDPSGNDKLVKGMVTCISTDGKPLPAPMFPVTLSRG